MSLHLAKLTDLTIASGQANSRWVDVENEMSDAHQISITAPSALDAVTYTIEVSEDGSTVSGTLHNGTSDVGLPAAGKVVNYDPFAVKYWRIHASGNAAADRDFIVRKLWNAW